MRDDTAAKKAVSDAARAAEQGFAEEFARQRAIRNREKSVVRRRTEAADNEAKRRRAMCESGQRTLDGKPIPGAAPPRTLISTLRNGDGQKGETAQTP